MKPRKDTQRAINSAAYRPSFAAMRTNRRRALLRDAGQMLAEIKLPAPLVGRHGPIGANYGIEGWSV